MFNLKSKEKGFEAFKEVLPHLKDIVQEDIMVCLTDKEKFLVYCPGEKMKAEITVGSSIPEDDPLRKTIQQNKIISTIVPKHVYGLPFKAVTYPINNSKGECIGAIGFAKSLEKISKSLYDVKDLVDNANNTMVQVTDNVIDISNKSNNQAEISSEISRAIESVASSVNETASNSQDINNIVENQKTNLKNINLALDGVIDQLIK